MTKKKYTYRVSEFADKVGVSASTVRRMDNDGRFPAKISSTGQRYYDDSDVRRFLNLPASIDRKTYVYCRVSSSSQKDDLARQVEAMEAFCLARGVAVDEVIQEIGGGLNMRRPKFLNLVHDITQGRVETLVIAHKDRLSRFGFDLIEGLAEKAGATIIVANAESLSPQEEMVQDLLSIVHTFSCRLYGLRKYEKTLKEATLGDSNQNTQDQTQVS